jgi:general secretion pathway protein E
MNLKKRKEEYFGEGSPAGSPGLPPKDVAAFPKKELSERGIEATASYLGIPFKKDILQDLAMKETFHIPIQYYKRMGIVPLRTDSGVLTVGICDPAGVQAADELAALAKCGKISLVFSSQEEIHSAINLLFDQSSDEAERVVQDIEADDIDGSLFSELDEMEDLLDTTHEAPVIRLVNVALTQALRREASDIHIEPYEKQVKVRFRIDGILYEIFSLPKKLHAHMVSRIKVMASLDIAEKRVPQDGRMKIKVGSKAVDIRVSIIPMAFGERIVMRLLDKSVSLVGLGEMGMTLEKLNLFEKQINKNSGILLVTGPTGSGKTTTLYAALSRINSQEKNVITIEDPIEYELKGVGQIQVNPKTELTFSRGLRSVLRHDPDIIMVGEIRDIETVEIAVQASLTGHLVFSTLHTNDAAGALTRLVDMGVEPFLIASSLLAVLAQRLVRRVCPECKEPFKPDRSTLKELNLPEDQLFWRGRGCDQCGKSGYRGRTGIFELLEVNDEIRHLLTGGADSVTIRNAAVGKGMTTLFQDGISKVRRGITTLSEVMRVTQE